MIFHSLFASLYGSKENDGDSDGDVGKVGCKLEGIIVISKAYSLHALHFDI